MPEAGKNLDLLCINAIRMLAVDMVEQANSGHPGMPLGAASMAYVLWNKFLRHDPANPHWPGRDRFVLSAGHGSALLYALLHLTGYDLPLEQLKKFRQWGSMTPGHPEYGLAPGVEATTGPLGQGFGMGAGMALARRFLSSTFDRPGFELFDYHIYAIVSDGDLMEGVASEAASLAGHMGLGRLVYLYDDNHISIEGNTKLTFSENVEGRFQAYNWQVQRVADGNDLQSMEYAIEKARSDTKRPSLIMVRTQIGYGSPRQDDAKSHGEPLGPENTAATRQNLGWEWEPFQIPDEVSLHMIKAREQGGEVRTKWEDRFKAYSLHYADEAEALQQQLTAKMPPHWQKALPVFKKGDGPIATRAASGKVINALAPALPHLVGGSADLAPSNKTMISDSGDMRLPGPGCGRNIHFGVREHGMGAMLNGMALHGGVIPYGGTFLVFSDYMRPSLRLAAIMQTKVVFIFTHDSIAVGEDGPTHQPIEHLMSLRVMPGMTVMRPADANETAAAWEAALSRSGPTCLLLSRQKLPVLDASAYPIAGGVPKGAYVLSGCPDPCQLILLASGAEVHLALEAQAALAENGVASQVVSMPSWELFAEQDQAYRDQVLPPHIKARLAIEAGATLGWERWVGDAGEIVGIDRFGASAPGGKALKNLGFNLENIMIKAQALLGRA
ncbi:MAG: transketolase [Desulfarculaceae bacterium]